MHPHLADHIPIYSFVRPVAAVAGGGLDLQFHSQLFRVGAAMRVGDGVTNAVRRPAVEVLRAAVAGYQASGRRLSNPNPVLSLLDLLDNYAAAEASEGIAACDAALQ